MTDLPNPSMEGRRAFLKKCATYGAMTPPAIALLLSSDSADAQLGEDIREFLCSNVFCPLEVLTEFCECPDGGAPSFSATQGFPSDPNAPPPE